MKNIPKTYRMNPLMAEDIKLFAERERISQSEALEMAWDEFSKSRDGEFEKYVDLLLDRFAEKYSNLFTGIRIASRSSDSQLQVLTEVINTMLHYQKVNHIIPTSSQLSPVLEDSRKIIKDKISAAKQNYDFKKVNK